MNHTIISKAGTTAILPSSGRRRRVVVTGMGAISPLGNSLIESWSKLTGRSSRSAIDTSEDDDNGSNNSVIPPLRRQQQQHNNNNNNNNNNNYSGITSLEEALVEHQNLSREQLDREWRLAKTLPCQVVAPVQDLEGAVRDRNCSGGGGAGLDRKTPRFVHMALVAGAEAMEQANLIHWLGESNNNNHHHNDDDEWNIRRDPDRERDRFGVCIGSGMSGVREIIDAWHATNANLPLHDENDYTTTATATATATIGIRKLSPHFIPKVLTNSAAGRLSLQYGLRGPNLAPSTACAAGSHAIGDAYRAIQYGDADLMLAGGAEASIEPLGMAGFCRLRALSTGYNTTPDCASRPFDDGRDGFVMGEGAAVLVLEELEHALSRGAPILAEISGYGLCGDAYHITAPDEEGRGAERAMMMALADASISGNDVGYVNAHATSTPKGDEIEANIISRVVQRHHMGDTNNSSSISETTSSTTAGTCHLPYVSSTKGATGHLLGAAGALEAAFTIMSLIDQRIPPTCNLNIDDNQQRDDGSQQLPLHFTHVTGTALDIPDNRLKVAMNNSFGFGGTNASLVFSLYTDR